MRHATLSTLAALALAGGLALASCGDSAESGATATRQLTAVTSCERTVALDEPPRRVVVIGAATSDTLFELGLGDRISALVPAEAKPLPRYRARLAALPSLGDQYPGREALLAHDPDLVIAEQAHRLAGSNGAPSIDELEAAGIPTYVAIAGCGGGDPTADLTSVFTDIDNLGTLLGVRARAQALIERLRGRLDDVRERIATRSPVRVAQITPIGGQLYATSGGVSDDMLRRAAAENVFADAPGQFVPVSSEVVTARNPEAIILFPPTSRREALDYLERTFPTTDAVKRDRLFVIDPAKAGSAGSTRLVGAVIEFARFLHPDAFPARQR